MDRRVELLSGQCSFPEQIRSIINPLQDETLDELLQDFFDACFYNYLLEKPIDPVIWFDRFNNKKLFNGLLMHLSKAGWITSEQTNNYVYVNMNDSKFLKWVTAEELLQLKHEHKFEKYRLKVRPSNKYDLVQINGNHRATGIIRKGFMKAGNHRFKYDTKYLSIYLDYIAINVKKGLTSSTKDITYQEICDELLNYYSDGDREYTLGRNISDSRGRAIFDCTHRIFNPIACKDARALLVCPSAPLDGHGVQAVYAAIAELNDYRGTSYEDKCETGSNMYILHEKPDLTEMELKQDYDDLHKLIWLERIYDKLDEGTEDWNIPIEIDAQASALEIIGVLTNDIEYMRGTNMIPNEPFRDIWSRDYVSRKHVKKAMTPQLYGSSKATTELWDANKLEYTQVQLNKMGEDISIGVYSNACKFKDFIINNVKPQIEMKVNVADQEFWIECNRFKWEEITQIDYYIYTSAQGLLKKVSRKSHRTPDPKQFKRFFVTLLCHSVDGLIADRMCQMLPWVISIHDSWTLHPNEAQPAREMYTAEMYNIWQNRKDILHKYFKSIGITKEYPEQTHDVNITHFSPYCLK